MKHIPERKTSETERGRMKRKRKEKNPYLALVQGGTD
jgi:hypothetical protein